MWQHREFSGQADDRGIKVRSATGNRTAPIPALCQVSRLLSQAMAHMFHCRVHHWGSHYTPATENQAVTDENIILKACNVLIIFITQYRYQQNLIINKKYGNLKLHNTAKYQSWGLTPQSYDYKTTLRPASVLVLYCWSDFQHCWVRQDAVWHDNADM